MVRLDDVADDAERVRTVATVHVLLENVDRPVAVSDVRGGDDRGVTLVPRRLHAQDIAWFWHARAVVGHLLKVAAVGTRVVRDDL